MRCGDLVRQKDFYFATSAFCYPTAECEASTDNTSELLKESISLSSVPAKPSEQRKKSGRGSSLRIENKVNLMS